MKITNLKNNSLVRETFIYSIGSFGSKILSFLLIPFYTFFLTKKDLGEYDILLTLMSLFAPIVSLQISDASYRWLVDKPNLDENYISKILSNSVIAIIAGFLMFFFIFFIYTRFNEFHYYIYFIVLIFLTSILSLLQSVLRGMGKTKKFAINGIITTFLIVIFNVIFIYLLNLKVEGIFIANIIAYIIACTIILVEINFSNYFDLKLFDKDLIISMVKYSIPLIPNLMSWWAIASASKFIILYFLGAENNGLYAVASRFPSLLLVINSVLLLPIQDKVLKDNSDLTFDKLLKKFIIFEIGFAFILGALSPVMTKFLVADNYFETWQFMPYLFLGVGFNAIAGFLGLKYQQNKNTLKITVTTLIGGVISILLSVLLVKRMGLQGISISFLIGYLVVFLLRYFEIFRNKTKRIQILFLILVPILSYYYILLIQKIL
ncbi:lipopolysaccharide biosynthesis protein [Empedobacter tilapiae]